MNPISLSDGEMVLLREARDQYDWTILPTWKLRYLFQRFIALPKNDVKTVKEISMIAAKETKKNADMQFEQAQRIFGLKDPPGQSKG